MKSLLHLPVIANNATFCPLSRAMPKYMPARPYSPLEFLQKRGLPIAVGIDSSRLEQATSLNRSINIIGRGLRTRIHSASDTDFVSIGVYFGVGVALSEVGGALCLCVKHLDSLLYSG